MPTIEIIFWGLALFVPSAGHYSVLVPDGRSGPYGIPPHTPTIKLLPESAKPAESWAWSKDIAKNEFVIEQPCSSFEISGIGGSGSAVDDSNFDDRLPNVKESDKNFRLSPTPKAMVAMTIDHGVLSAHQYPSGMIATMWTVQAADVTAVRIKCGSNTLTLAGDTKRIVLSNFAHDPHHNTNHFRLYRVLSTDPSGQLGFKKPKKQPGGPVSLAIATPLVDCSTALMKEIVGIE